MALRQLLPDEELYNALSPEGKQKPDDSLQVDIVAIHGLNVLGKNDEAHAFDTWTKDDHLWLRDDLIHLTPNARVLLYVYNSKGIFRGQKHNFVDAADTLISLLHGIRRRCPRRPLILIGHSLGGLLIEQTIINAHQSIAHHRIYESVASLVFFGTPHRGGHDTLVRLGTAAANVARSLGGQMNQDIMQHLNEKSLLTEIREHGFRNRKLDFKIISFWEGIGNIVSKSSATYGLPDDKEVVIEISATHSDICRFNKTREDQDRFKLVSNTLEEEYDNIIQQVLSIMHSYFDSVNEWLKKAQNAARSKQGVENHLHSLTNTLSYHNLVLMERDNGSVPPFLFYEEESSSQGNLVDSLLYCREDMQHQLILGGCYRNISVAQPSLRINGAETRDVDTILWSILSQTLRWIDSDVSKAFSVCCKDDSEIIAALSEGQKLQPKTISKAMRVAASSTTSKAILVLSGIEALTQLALTDLIETIKEAYTYYRLHANLFIIVIGTPSLRLKITDLSKAPVINRWTEYRECKAALQDDRMYKRAKRISKAEPGTCAWVWSNKEFLKMETDRSAILWISGKPGSGKSVLASNIVSRLSNRDSATQVLGSSSYIICSWYYSKRDDLQSHLVMLKSLLWQFLDQQPLYFRHIAELYRKRGPVNDDGFWTSEELMSVLERIIMSTKNIQIFLVLDGLDESNRKVVNGEFDLSRMLDKFLGLAAMSNNLKILLLSRPDPDITDKLHSCSQICMQLENSDDILKVISTGLSLLIDCVLDESYDSSNRDIQLIINSLREPYRQVIKDIHSCLVEKAHGVFLWVSVILARLKNRADNALDLPFELTEEMESLSDKELDEIYARIVQDLNSSPKHEATKRRAKRAILWTSVVTRTGSLRISHLYEIVSIKSEEQLSKAPQLYRDMASQQRRTVSLSQPIGPKDFKKRLQMTCGPFLEFLYLTNRRTHVDDFMSYEVQLLHQTVKEFLESDPRADFLQIPGPKEAESLVKADASQYLELAFPRNPPEHHPLSIRSNMKSKSKAKTVVEYLQHKPLMSLILREYPDLGGNIAPDHLEMFDTVLEQSFEIVEDFVHEACLQGASVSLENFFRTQFVHSRKPSVKLGSRCYRFEVPVIRGALRAAIKQGLIEAVEVMTWYIGVRNLNILGEPLEVMNHFDSKLLIREALHYRWHYMIMVLIGYEDHGRRGKVEDWIKAQLKASGTTMTDDRRIPPGQQVSRTAIGLIIGLWCRPTVLTDGESRGNIFSLQRYSVENGDFGFLGPPGQGPDYDLDRYVQPGRYVLPRKPRDPVHPSFKHLPKTYQSHKDLCKTSAVRKLTEKSSQGNDVWENALCVYIKEGNSTKCEVSWETSQRLISSAVRFGEQWLIEDTVRGD